MPAQQQAFAFHSELCTLYSALSFTQSYLSRRRRRRNKKATRRPPNRSYAVR